MKWCQWCIYPLKERLLSSLSHATKLGDIHELFHMDHPSAMNGGGGGSGGGGVAAGRRPWGPMVLRAVGPGP